MRGYDGGRVRPLDPARTSTSMCEHVRDLWTLHGIQSKVTAVIYRNHFGLELRIGLAGELMHSQLSREVSSP